MSGKERFEKEALGGSRISGRTEPEIERVSLRNDGSVEVDPLIFDFDRGLIDLPQNRLSPSREDDTAFQVQVRSAGPTDTWSYGR